MPLQPALPNSAKLSLPPLASSAKAASAAAARRVRGGRRGYVNMELTDKTHVLMPSRLLRLSGEKHRIELKKKEIIMKKSSIKWVFISSLFVLCIFTWAQAQESKTIKLPEPAKKGGLSIMETFAKRASSRSWEDKDLSQQDLSNLLWAANGINRPDKKRTAPSAMNVQDVDIYVLIKSGVYLYDAANHALNLIASGDHRSEIGMSMGGSRPSGGTPGSAPTGGAPAGGAPSAPSEGKAGGPGGDNAGKSMPAANLIMVSDLSKFSMGNDAAKKEMGIIDASIVSENINLFCAGNGLATVPRIGSISNQKDALKTLLKLKDTQYIVIENPVGNPSTVK
jgi:nitroreductase